MSAGSNIVLAISFPSFVRAPGGDVRIVKSLSQPIFSAISLGRVKDVLSRFLIYISIIAHWKGGANENESDFL